MHFVMIPSLSRPRKSAPAGTPTVFTQLEQANTTIADHNSEHLWMGADDTWE